MTSSHRFVRLVPFALLLVMGLASAKLAHRSPAADMSTAAERFLSRLTPELRARASVGFDDKARMDWHFVPRTRPGVRLGELNDEQRSAARDLLRSALSARGVLKAEGIMALDAVLREMEKAAGGDGASRDPLSYTIAIYGTPGAKAGAWGWKIEGHHLSLNFTIGADGAVAATPAFMGTHPARVASGPQAGLRVLAVEEDLGRELAASLDDQQRKEGILSGEVPREILTLPGRPLDAAASVGLGYSAMTPVQQSMLVRLIEEYAHNLQHELTDQEMERIRSAGLDKVRFAWAGAFEPGRPHYYRISGPTFVIEYDNMQNNADHVHTVWHNRERDFGKDLLKEHYEHGHPHE